MGSPPTPPGDQCDNCIHYRGLLPMPSAEEGLELEWLPHCDAFPDGEGIPDELLRDLADHTLPFPGDNGVRFEMREKNR